MPPVYPKAASAATAEHHHLHPHVVVVDDEPEIVSMILETLGDEHIPATSCGYGHAAYTCLRTKLPEVVLLDIQMPGLDGIEIFKRLKADRETAGMYVIFITANAHRLEQWFPDYAQRGAFLLRKPFDLDALVDMVRTGLGATAA